MTASKTGSWEGGVSILTTPLHRKEASAAVSDLGDENLGGEGIGLPAGPPLTLEGDDSDQPVQDR